MVQSKAAFSGMSVDDLDKAKEFYTQKLGLKLVDEGMGIQLSLPGGGELFIYSKPDHQPASYTALNFVVDNIDTAVDELKDVGVEIEHYDGIPNVDEKGIARGLSSNMGPDIGWFTDPAGNVLSVLQSQ